MKLGFKITLLLYSAVLGIALPMAAYGADGAREFTKTIKKEYDIIADGTVNLSNKYGKVEVKTWDKNRVKIEVTILVNANSESQAQEVFDRISINFTNSTALVKAETVIEPAKRSWWNWGSSTSDYKINYLVYMPATNNLELSNRYGDAYVAELKNRADITVKYGNFKSDGIGDRANIDLAYGNGTIAKTGYIQGMVSYGSLTCTEVKDADITSKYSKISLERGQVIRSASKYDEYRLGNIQEFRNTGGYDNFDIRSADKVFVSTKYSNVTIGRLTNTLDLSMSYGSGVISKVVKDFGGITLNGKYTDFKINLEAGADARFEAAGSYGGINYPNGMSVSYEKEQGQSREVKGHIGSGSGKALIKAQISYGSLRVRQE
ncbi:MAG: hypothetical protein KF852_12045 [Saprospiraceae bacterium]|nr:hypothetical protein [Saprospiraceae bacterium]